MPDTARDAMIAELPAAPIVILHPKSEDIVPSAVDFEVIARVSVSFEICSV
jgi:hypothetical protein